MNKRMRTALAIVLYVVIFAIGLYLIIAGKDWRGYVALLGTPLLHTLVKALSKA